MKRKFWGIYLGIMILSLAVGYFAMSDESNVPLVLSDIQMKDLQGTTTYQNWVCAQFDPCSYYPCNNNEKVLRTGVSGCYSCKPQTGSQCTYTDPAVYCSYCHYTWYSNFCYGTIAYQTDDTARKC